MRTTLESYLVDAAATEAIASAKGIPQLLLPHVRRPLRSSRKTGSTKSRGRSDGAPRMNGKGEFLGIKDLVSEMKESDIFARAFEGSGTSGGGSPANPSPARGGSFVLSRADAKDPMKYRAAREAAAKAGQELQIAPE